MKKSINFLWHDNSKLVPEGSHALFGGSKYSWINYDIDKMIETYSKEDMKKIGTEMHELAEKLIKNKIKLQDSKKTFNEYVNDAIAFDLKPEVLLYYSDLFYGFADSIGLVSNVLHIHDLKTGKTRASIKQLEIYAAFFFLEYQKQISIDDVDDIELRIYQCDKILVENPDRSEIKKIMDKIVTVDELIKSM